ncbi:hypothetical protein BDZ45DRAFT_140087 [Acephala macrosclerotiorum]|nr:hypothetical protein BDZ45DRAFT_140087 [Acephala macrosclerotiorum]
MSILEKIYFETIYPIMPIIHYERYISCQTLNVRSRPPLYLRYAVWAVAAIGVKQHSYQSSENYTKARNLAEAAALTDPRSTQSALYRAQAWLHLAMHDIMCGCFALAWANTVKQFDCFKLQRFTILIL